MTITKVPVSILSVIQRINRRLAEEGKVLKKTRSTTGRQRLGDYYLLDRQSNEVVQDHVDLLVVAQQLAVLQPWEMLQEED